MGFQIRRVKLTSPTNPPADIHLSSGLNVIAGASNTGKSFLVELIRFGLGSLELQKKIREAERYDRLYLLIENENKQKFTIVRALAGGDAIVFDGDVSESLDSPPVGITPPALLPSPNDTANDLIVAKSLIPIGRTLPARSSASTNETLPGFLLGLVNMTGKRIKDKSASTRNLTFRDLRELVVIDEQRIIATNSPALSGDRQSRTAEAATLSLLLTGVDDSAIVIAEQYANKREEHLDKAQKISFLVKELKSDIPESVTTRTIAAQLKKIEASIVKVQDSYNNGFLSVSTLEKQREKLIKERGEVSSQVDSLGQLVNRFGVLQSKYDSDIERLSALGEAADQFETLAGEDCPLCGAPLTDNSPHHDALTQKNGPISTGLEAERRKILLLKLDLANTLEKLESDVKEFSKRKIVIEEEIKKIELRLDQRLKPASRELSGTLSSLLDKKAELKELLSNLERIDRYKNLQNEEVVAAKELKAVDTQRNDTKAKSEFSQIIENMLSAWKYPESGKTFFSEDTQDIVIQGKHRASLGKGYRAITASAFIIGAMEYCHANNLPHPGFVILDTPVRTFKDREHDGDKNDAISDEVKDAFFADLALRLTNKQIIVAENDLPPFSVRQNINYVYFSGNPSLPPSGYIPSPTLQLP